MSHRRLALVLLLGMLACPANASSEDDPAAAAAPKPALTAETYAHWKGVLGVQPEDLVWERIDWVPSYREGLVAAAEAQKPILLWVMNGHPLGCT